MSEQYSEATNSNGLSVFHHPQKDPLTQTKSFRTSMGPLLSIGEPHRPRERHFRIYYRS